MSDRRIAHRGGGLLGPENSLAACAAALEAGFTAFEVDVKLCRDGAAVLVHDDDLLRTHGHPGRASALPWATLAALDGAAVARLDDFAALMRPRGAWVNLEIKPDACADLPTQHDWGARIAAQAAALWAGAAPPVLSSFSVAALQGAAGAAPQLPRALLRHELPEGWRGLAASLRLSALHLEAGRCTPSTLEAVHAAGLALRLWGDGANAGAADWLARGADGVFVDPAPGDRPAGATPRRGDAPPSGDRP